MYTSPADAMPRTPVCHWLPTFDDVLLAISHFLMRGENVVLLSGFL
jgi:hypothetical protein